MHPLGAVKLRIPAMTGMFEDHSSAPTWPPGGSRKGGDKGTLLLLMGPGTDALTVGSKLYKVRSSSASPSPSIIIWCNVVSKPNSAVTLVEVTEACLAIAAEDAVGMVMIAESAGLMGAALRRSPAVAPVEGAPFAYPQIREWLSFTAERAYSRSLALVAGVAASTEHPALAPFIRPLGKNPQPAGHFHAAAFAAGLASLAGGAACSFQVT